MKRSFQMLATVIAMTLVGTFAGNGWAGHGGGHGGGGGSQPHFSMGGGMNQSSSFHPTSWQSQNPFHGNSQSMQFSHQMHNSNSHQNSFKFDNFHKQFSSSQSCYPYQNCWSKNNYCGSYGNYGNYGSCWPYSCYGSYGSCYGNGFPTCGYNYCYPTSSCYNYCTPSYGCYSNCYSTGGYGGGSYGGVGSGFGTCGSPIVLH